MYGKDYIEMEDETPVASSVFFETSQLLRAATFLHEKNKCGVRNANRTLDGWMDLITSYIRENAGKTWLVSTCGFTIVYDYAGEGRCHAEILVDPAVGDEVGLRGYTQIDFF